MIASQYTGLVFTAMAKRFGGVPLVTKVIQYPDDAANLEVPRASEEETWDQILADYDRAIELLQPTSPKTGFCNKYKALAFSLLCDDTQRELGNLQKADKMRASCEKYGWIPVSMRDDFKTIYGDNVTRAK